MAEKIVEDSTDEIDIYNTTKNFNNFISLLKASKKVTEENKEIILDLIRWLKVEGRGRTLKTLMNYLIHWTRFASLTKKNLNNLTAEDIQIIVEHVGATSSTEQSRVTRLSILKKGFKEIKRYPLKESPHIKYPHEVAWICTSPNKQKMQAPMVWEDLITEEEIYKKAVKVATSSRDRLILVMLRESGVRISSISHAKVADVEFRGMGFLLKNQHGKVRRRDIHFYIATPYMRDWLNSHEAADDPNAPLFICLGPRNRGQALKYSGYYTMLEKVFKRAGIKKKANPHLLRHSHISLMQYHIPQSLMEEQFDWERGSVMTARYTHISSRHLNDTLTKLRGLGGHDLPKPMAAPVCYECNVIAKIHNMRCPQCNNIVHLEDVDMASNRMKEKLSESNSAMVNQFASAFMRALDETKGGFPKQRKSF